MTTCKTCKHWTRHPWPNRLGWHDTGTCATLHVTHAHTISERDMFPMLDTHRDFGCVKWDGERREDITVSFPEFGEPDLIVRFENTVAQFNAATEAWERYTKKLLRTVEEIMREDCR